MRNTIHNTRYLLQPVGENGRLMAFSTRPRGASCGSARMGRLRSWSNVARAIAGANALNGREVYFLNPPMQDR
jgi:hypothetical protein